MKSSAQNVIPFRSSKDEFKPALDVISNRQIIHKEKIRFTFEEWMLLIKTDESVFEELSEKHLDENNLRALRWRIDQKRRLSKIEFASCILLFSKMLKEL